jgi:hypothetical protein
MKHYIALTCEALTRSIYALSAESDNTITVRLFKQGLHNRPPNLRDVLQAQIDAIEPDECDAILLVYGICGMATVGLTARHTPLVIPRAHDCITLILGSRERYQTEFNAHPGTYWYTVDYMEHLEEGSSVALGAAGIEDEQKQYDEYVAKFGQETADMLIEEMRQWSRHYSRAAFVDMGLGNSTPFEQKAQDKAAAEGWIYERKNGSNRLLAQLIAGDWSEEDFLIVPPGQTITQVYDDRLVDAANKSDD